MNKFRSILEIDKDSLNLCGDGTLIDIRSDAATSNPGIVQRQLKPVLFIVVYHGNNAVCLHFF